MYSAYICMYMAVHACKIHVGTVHVYFWVKTELHLNGLFVKAFKVMIRWTDSLCGISMCLCVCVCVCLFLFVFL